MNLYEVPSLMRAAAGIMHGSRAFGGPVQSIISLTNRCNIRCIHCYFYSPYLEKPNMLELRHAKYKNQPLPIKANLKDLQSLDADSNATSMLLDEFSEMGTKHIHFTGHGEPLLHKNVLDFMGRAKHAGARCSIDTNGTLLDRSKINELIRMGFDELKITIMAGTKEIYLKTHPGVADKTFDTLRDNLLYIKERKVALNVKNPHITLIAIVTSHNTNGLQDFAKFAGFVGADKVMFRPVDGYWV